MRAERPTSVAQYTNQRTNSRRFQFTEVSVIRKTWNVSKVTTIEESWYIYPSSKNSSSQLNSKINRHGAKKSKNTKSHLKSKLERYVEKGRALLWLQWLLLAWIHGCRSLWMGNPLKMYRKVRVVLVRMMMVKNMRSRRSWRGCRRGRRSARGWDWWSSGQGIAKGILSELEQVGRGVDVQLSRLKDRAELDQIICKRKRNEIFYKINTYP